MSKLCLVSEIKPGLILCKEVCHIGVDPYRVQILLPAGHVRLRDQRSLQRQVRIDRVELIEGCHNLVFKVDLINFVKKEPKTVVSLFFHSKLVKLSACVKSIDLSLFLIVICLLIVVKEDCELGVGSKHEVLSISFSSITDILVL